MASTTCSDVQQLVETINSDGFISMKDAAKGSEADEFARKGFPIPTVEGIEFCKVHIFDDPLSAS